MPRCSTSSVCYCRWLDRCRSDYAIKLLEGIKHLFGIPGVYFVISTNAQQLSHSVKAIYGSEFDGQRYLRRFFNLYYSLPKPDNEKFIRMSFGDLDLPKAENLVHGLENQEHFQFHKGLDKPQKEWSALDVLTYVLGVYAEELELGLRDQHQIVTILEASFYILKNKKIHIYFLTFLAIIYHQHPALFNDLEKARNILPFKEKYKNFAGKDLVIVKPHSEMGVSSSGQSHHSLINEVVPKVYLANMEINMQARNDLIIKTDKFPFSLLEDILMSSKHNPGLEIIPAYGAYFGIIKCAGVFREEVKRAGNN